MFVYGCPVNVCVLYVFAFFVKCVCMFVNVLVRFHKCLSSVFCVCVWFVSLCMCSFVRVCVSFVFVCVSLELFMCWSYVCLSVSLLRMRYEVIRFVLLFSIFWCFSVFTFVHVAETIYVVVFVL